ncbi:hypothetical protein I4F81_011471 [Pyropia yezoensis]|uniref:Uncharacterized protein n=1 Tax=Pyropia yezoensis TaxID=2788 RepID=A0ACC3CGD3_PYRYE|nr:hypothetical protein I4F81_011471 [Neopyropia yezoensis]
MGAAPDAALAEPRRSRSAVAARRRQRQRRQPPVVETGTWRGQPPAPPPLPPPQPHRCRETPSGPPPPPQSALPPSLPPSPALLAHPMGPRQGCDRTAQRRVRRRAVRVGEGGTARRARQHPDSRRAQWPPRRQDRLLPKRHRLDTLGGGEERHKVRLAGKGHKGGLPGCRRPLIGCPDTHTPAVGRRRRQSQRLLTHLYHPRRCCGRHSPHLAGRRAVADVDRPLRRRRHHRRVCRGLGRRHRRRPSSVRREAAKKLVPVPRPRRRPPHRCRVASGCQPHVGEANARRGGEVPIPGSRREGGGNHPSIAEQPPQPVAPVGVAMARRPRRCRRVVADEEEAQGALGVAGRCVLFAPPPPPGATASRKKGKGGGGGAFKASLGRRSGRRRRRSSPCRCRCRMGGRWRRHGGGRRGRTRSLSRRWRRRRWRSRGSRSHCRRGYRGDRGGDGGGGGGGVTARAAAAATGKAGQVHAWPTAAPRATPHRRGDPGEHWQRQLPSRMGGG